VVATDAAAFLQTISGSGLKPMTVPNLPQETCRVRTRKKAHGRAMGRNFGAILQFAVGRGLLAINPGRISGIR
jgi:hypothetical protein